jgi:tetratricopeptide (TPR) repeat protein
LEGIWQDLALGFAVQNLTEPRLRMQDSTETYPRAFRAGLAKPLRVGGEGNFMNLFLGYQSGAEEQKGRLQFGGEYVYQGRAMLRMGMNGGPTFGGGVVYQNFQIDYALGRFSNDAAEVFAPNHRISMTVQLGKSKQELLETRRRKEDERIAESIAREQKLKDQAAFAKAMEDGRIYFEKGDFYQAQLSFGEASRIFPGDEDARIWVEKSQQREQEEQQRRNEELEKIAATRAKREADSLFVEARIAEGMKYFNAGEFGEAVRQWEVGLSRDPKNTRLQELIAKTKSELDNRVAEVLRKARSAEQAGRFSEAIQAYNKALSDGALTASQRAEVTNQITKLQNQMNVQEMYKQGVAAYSSRDYRTAVSYFDEVIKIEPRNNLAQKYRYDAESRLNAQAKDFATDQVRARFAEAAKLSQRGNFVEALKILEEIQREDRYNKRILDAIDQARDKLNRK